MDEKWGEVPCAFIELKPEYSQDDSVTEQALIDHCTEHMAGFKKPRKCIIGPISKNVTGKIQKFELHKQFTKD